MVMGTRNGFFISIDLLVDNFRKNAQPHDHGGNSPWFLTKRLKIVANALRVPEICSLTHVPTPFLGNSSCSVSTMRWFWDSHPNSTNNTSNHRSHPKSSNIPFISIHHICVSSKPWNSIKSPTYPPHHKFTEFIPIFSQNKNMFSPTYPSPAPASAMITVASAASWLISSAEAAWTTWPADGKSLGWWMDSKVYGFVWK